MRRGLRSLFWAAAWFGGSAGPHPIDLRPRDLRMLTFESRRQSPYRLADNHDVSVNVGLNRRITIERSSIPRKIPHHLVNRPVVE